MTSWFPAFHTRHIQTAVIGIVWLACNGNASSAVDVPDAPFQTAEEIAAFLDNQPFEIGFCAKALNTEDVLERFAERDICLASIVKLFCLTELYRQKHDLNLDLDQKIEVPGRGMISLKQAADLMIGISDNPATHALADFLGRDRVNAIPALLGIDAMSPDILPEERVLHQALDKRINGDRLAEKNLPQHGTAKGMVSYLELLLHKKVVSEAVSKDLLEFLVAHPMPYTTLYAGKCEMAGKGGNILWTRPPKHFSMMGWAVLVKMPSGKQIILCLWGEWFPENMPPKQQMDFLRYVTDSLLTILDAPHPPYAVPL